MRSRFLTTVAALLLALRAGGLARAELKPDQIALLVNKNSPDSQALAEFYVKARQLPEGRIISLDLPATDDIPFDQYERLVVPQVRRFLENNHLDKQVRSIVSMYGVPLRIAPRTNTPAEQAELASLKPALVRAEVALIKVADDLNAVAARVDPNFHPIPQSPATAGADGILRRIEHASQALALSTQRTTDPLERQKQIDETNKILQRLREGLTGAASDPATEPTTSPSTTAAESDDAQREPIAANATLAEIAQRRYDPAARRRLRDELRRTNLLEYARLLRTQTDYLSSKDTGAAFDSELSLLWWPNYPREKFFPNALQYHYLKSRTPPVIMTMRLDAPTPQLVRDMIATSIAVERGGLDGGFVIDAGGNGKLDPQKKNPAVGEFDKQFVDLSQLVRANTKLLLCFDNGVEVLPPQSAKDVALYTGWYSVGKYQPCCTFTRGAVGYHVASYEMTSLHDNNNSGWCRGLINDGVVATLGPVGEPYLGAFPLPSDFFPLLMTGQLTLAEVYWGTTPLTSWMMTMVGDPLYTPFRVKPALPVSALPERLRPLLEVSK